MYTYIAGATGLDASFPPWVQSGGLEAWIARMKDPAVRARLVKEMRTPERLGKSAPPHGQSGQGPAGQLQEPELKPLTGKTLAEVAKMRGKSPEETAMDLVIEDGSRVGTVYFLMSEDNVKREVGLPWMSFGSDEGSPAPEGVFLKSQLASARLRQCRAAPWPLCPRRACGDPAGRSAPADIAARRPISASASADR